MKITPIKEEITWVDAHNHLQDPHFSFLGDSLYKRLGISNTLCLVNGTSPGDWETIQTQCSSSGIQPTVQLLPAYGIHPWKTGEYTPQCLERLDSLLNEQGASLGEVGLDRWIQNTDFDKQLKCLHEQLELVQNRRTPITFHCLKAWNDFRGTVGKWLQRYPRPFLLHAYGGPASEVDYWVECGAYFSFSPYFLHPRKHSVREIFRTLPADRLLVETDAPSMLPPPDDCSFQIAEARDGTKLNLPSNLIPTYHALARLRGLPLSTLQRIILQNFSRFYFSEGGTTGA